jgi:hypothetical protein
MPKQQAKDEKMVSMAHLSVPEGVKDYWRIVIATKKINLSQFLRDVLVAELGCPPGYDPVTLKPLASDD